MPHSSSNSSSLEISAEVLIQEAFERIGIPAEFVEYQKLEAALRSLNLLLSAWMTHDVNLWTIQKKLLPLNEGQYKYDLDETVLDVIQASLITSYRQLGGDALSYAGDGSPEQSGTPENAFDGNPRTSCTQTEPNGWIAYDFVHPQTITLVGIQSNQKNTYSLVLEVDGRLAFSFPPALSYEVAPNGIGIVQWFSLEAPVRGQAYKIKETEGGILDIQEIYLNVLNIQTPITKLSRFDYEVRPLPQQKGRPSSYYLNRQIVPELYLYPAPSSFYKLVSFSYTQKPKRIADIFQVVQIPSQFYEALCWGIAMNMAFKYKPEQIDLATRFYETSLSKASFSDSENTPFKLGVNTNAYRR